MIIIVQLGTSTIIKNQKVIETLPITNVSNGNSNHMRIFSRKDCEMHLAIDCVTSKYVRVKVVPGYNANNSGASTGALQLVCG